MMDPDFMKQNSNVSFKIYLDFFIMVSIFIMVLIGLFSLQYYILNYYPDSVMNLDKFCGNIEYKSRTCRSTTFISFYIWQISFSLTFLIIIAWKFTLRHFMVPKPDKLLKSNLGLLLIFIAIAVFTLMYVNFQLIRLFTNTI